MRHQLLPAQVRVSSLVRAFASLEQEIHQLLALMEDMDEESGSDIEDGSEEEDTSSEGTSGDEDEDEESEPCGFVDLLHRPRFEGRLASLERWSIFVHVIIMKKTWTRSPEVTSKTDLKRKILRLRALLGMRMRTLLPAQVRVSSLVRAFASLEQEIHQLLALMVV
jgi:hypothetical protein